MTSHTSSEPLADTRLYQAVHRAFRLATTRLVDATEKVEPSALQPIIGKRWTFYETVLHQHHHDEDASVFPALLVVRPDLQALVEQLEDDHRQLIPTMDMVSAAVTAFDAEPDPVHQTTLHDGLTSLRDLFFPHLDVEDAQILPACGESIPPTEWERIDQAALKSIPREHLPHAIASLDEVIRGLPEDERPLPPPLPIRLMLAVSWRRRWTQWWKPLLS